jgi:hypothetical protein
MCCFAICVCVIPCVADVLLMCCQCATLSICHLCVLVMCVCVCVSNACVLSHAPVHLHCVCVFSHVCVCVCVCVYAISISACVCMCMQYVCVCVCNTYVLRWNTYALRGISRSTHKHEHSRSCLECSSLKDKRFPATSHHQRSKRGVFLHGTLMTRCTLHTAHTLHAAHSTHRLPRPSRTHDTCSGVVSCSEACTRHVSGQACTACVMCHAWPEAYTASITRHVRGQGPAHMAREWHA